MRDYSHLSPLIWIGRTGKALRHCLEGQIVACYLVSSPHDNLLGLYYLPLTYIANDTGLSPEQVHTGMKRAMDAGFCAYDTASEMVWVYNMARFQVAEQLKDKDKRIFGVRAVYASLPHNPFLGPFFDRYAQAFQMDVRRDGTTLEAPPEPLASPLQDPVKPSPAPAAAPPAPPRPKKPGKPRGRDFGIAALDMPEDVAEQFERVWKSWPLKGWNYKTRTAGPRRLNFAEAAKRFFEVVQFNEIVKEGGERLTASDLADAAIAWLNPKIQEAAKQNLPPCVPCIGNFFSSCEGEKHPWKEAVLQFFDMVEATV